MTEVESKSNTYLAKYQEQILRDTNTIYHSYLEMLKVNNNEYDYPEEGPITSDLDRSIIEQIIQTKSYILLTTNNTVYTIGLWLLYGIPELAFNITLPTINDNDTIDLDNTHDLTKLDFRIKLITNTFITNCIDEIQTRLFSSDDNNVKMNKKYEWPDATLSVLNQLHLNCDTSKGENMINLELRRVEEDEYLKLGTLHMLWFYSYYLKADERNVIVPTEQEDALEDGDGIEFQLYPVYQIDINYSDYADSDTVNRNVQQEMDATINKYINMNYSDFSDSDTYDSESTN